MQCHRCSLPDHGESATADDLTKIARGIASESRCKSMRRSISLKSTKSPRSRRPVRSAQPDQAAYFDYVADKACNPADQAELHRVADQYRTLDRRADLLPRHRLSRTDAMRFRAEECRTLADQFRSPECRKYLNGLASTYDYLAESNATTDFLHSLDANDLSQYD